MIAQAPTRTVDEVFLSGYESAARRVLRPGRITRLVALARARSLDGALADGDDPAGSAQRAARAAVLGAPATRAATADQLEQLLQTAAGDARGRWSVRPHRSSIIANARTIRALAALLRGATPLRVRGIAMLQALLRDGTGPAYVGDDEKLARRLDEALVEMRP